MPYPSAAIANRFLEIAKPSRTLVDPMKLQKLVYFAHGWHLGFDEGPLCSEFVEAWRWGPVFPDLYHEVKRCGSKAVTSPVRALEVEGTTVRLTEPDIPVENDFARKLAERVWEVYGRMSGPALSQLTHEREGPWRVTWDKARGAHHRVIPNELIALHFQNKLRENART